MFENVLGQEAVLRITSDLRNGTLPPSILFEGPPAAGKGTAALELGRALSCNNPEVPWNCTCPECDKHRQLNHPDLLLLGSKAFSAEIAASSAAYLRDPESAAKLLFFRSVRKLLYRFNPVLWEGEEGRLSKLSPLLNICDEILEELGSSNLDKAGLEKLVTDLMKHAFQLEREGISDTIPIFQIRRASYWSRLAPSGKRKLLIIENADRMQDGARNALLKILEEPPETTQIVLCTTQKAAMLPTIRSRLRPYAFEQRSHKTEQEVIRRVFRDPEIEKRADVPNLQKYLESFLPITPEQVSRSAAIFFSVLIQKARNKEVRNQNNLKTLLSYGNTFPELDVGLQSSFRGALLVILKDMENFSIPLLFSGFLKELLNICGELLATSQAAPALVSLLSMWKAHIKEADTAVIAYNQSPASSLERLFVSMLETI